MRTPSGEQRFAEASYLPDVVDGQVRGILVLAIDITARRHAESARDASDARLRALLEQLPNMAVWLVDKDLRLESFGGRLSEQPGLDIASLLGKPIAEIAGGGELGAQVAALYARALNGERVKADIDVPPRPRAFALEIAPLRDSEGTISGALGVAHDISERRLVEAELQLRSQISEHMGEGAILTRRDDFTIVHTNVAVDRMFGYEPGELIGQHVGVLNAPGEIGGAEVAEDIARQVAGMNGPWRGAVRSRRKDGTLFWRHSTIMVMEHPEHGELFVSVLSDITERLEREAEEKAFATLAERVAEGDAAEEIFDAVAVELQKILECDMASVIRIDTDKLLGTVLGSQGADGAKINGHVLDLTRACASASVLDTGHTARFDATAAFKGEVDATLEEVIEERHLISTYAAPVTIHDAIWGTVAAGFTDARDREGVERRLERFASLVALSISAAQAREELAHQASTDHLTGLANRRVFTERLDFELERAKRYGRDLSLVLIDVDHFKQVNDRHGHDIGDQVLVTLADLLAGHARASDLVARIGGEEFAWLLPETAADVAHGAADHVRELIAATTIEPIGKLTISAGVCSNAHAEHASDLLRRADQAMYAAKNSGRNVVCRDTAD